MFSFTHHPVGIQQFVSLPFFHFLRECQYNTDVSLIEPCRPGRVVARAGKTPPVAMSPIPLIGQIFLFILLFAGVVLFFFKGPYATWFSKTLTSIKKDLKNDVQLFFQRGIFKRLDMLNQRYSKIWNKNHFLIADADESNWVSTEPYKDIYNRLDQTAKDWSGLSKEIVRIFQDTDRFIQDCSIYQLGSEALKVKLHRSSLDTAEKRIQRLAKITDVYAEIHREIERVPELLKNNLDEVKKKVRHCLVDHLDVIEEAEGDSLETHLRRLAAILKEQEEMAVLVSKSKGRQLTNEQKEALCLIHQWTLRAFDAIAKAERAFGSVNQKYEVLTDSEEVVQMWYESYELFDSAALVDGIRLDDLEKRIIALRELWKGYTEEFYRNNVSVAFADREDRLRFMVDEVERFEQDMNMTESCKAEVEEELKSLSGRESLLDWIEKTKKLSPFKLEFEDAEAASMHYEKALIAWDNPRPYTDVQAFVEHAKRMVEEITEYKEALRQVKLSYRQISAINHFHQTLKNGFLKQQISSAYALYQYANQHEEFSLSGWGMFEEILERAEGMVKDNPIAYAQRHDPIPGTQVQAIMKEVDQFKTAWKQALTDIQEHYEKILDILRKEIERMGNDWQTFMLDMQGQGGRGVIIPFSLIPMPQSGGELETLLRQKPIHDSVAQLGVSELVKCHTELCELHKKQKSIEELVDGISIKKRSIKHNIDRCQEILQHVDTYYLNPFASMKKQIQEHNRRVEEIDEYAAPSESPRQVWEKLGEMESLTRNDLIQFEAMRENLDQQYAELERLRHELGSMIDQAEHMMTEGPVQHIPQESKEEIESHVQQVREADNMFLGREKVDYDPAKEILEGHIKLLKRNLDLLNAYPDDVRNPAINNENWNSSIRRHVS